jgi:effector-binding domain-containing protein
VYGRLFAWMEQKQVKANGFIREIGYDNPMLTPPEKCRQEICVPVSDGIQSEPGIEIKTLPQSDVISIVYRGSLDFQSMGPAYKALMQWAGANGKRTEYSIVTYYTSPHNREKAEVEIAMVVA